MERKKRVRTRYRNLRGMGVPRDLAWIIIPIWMIIQMYLIFLKIITVLKSFGIDWRE